MNLAQQKTIGRGIVAQVERSKEQHRLTVQFAWSGAVPENTLLWQIDNMLEARFPVAVTTTRVREDEAARLSAALEKSEQQIEQLRARLQELEAQQARPPQRIPLKDWAEQMHKSYSWAWRQKNAGRIQFTVVGGGLKHDNVLVDPATYVPAIPKGKSA